MCHCLYWQSCSMLQLLLLWDLWLFSCHAACVQIVVGHRLRLLPAPKACSGLSATAAPHQRFGARGDSTATPQPPQCCPAARRTPLVHFTARAVRRGARNCLLQAALPAFPSPLAWDTGWARLCWGSSCLGVSEGSHRGSARRGVGPARCAGEGLGARWGSAQLVAALPSLLRHGSTRPFPNHPSRKHQSRERRSRGRRWAAGAGGCSRTGQIITFNHTAGGGG